MALKITVKMNSRNLRAIERATVKALPLTMDAMVTEVNNMQVVPKEIGDLEQSVTKKVEGGRGYIGYNSPYARALYYSPHFNFRTEMNSHAQGRWLDPFIIGSKRKWLVNTFAEFVKREAGGVIR